MRVAVSKLKNGVLIFIDRGTCSKCRFLVSEILDISSKWIATVQSRDAKLLWSMVMLTSYFIHGLIVSKDNDRWAPSCPDTSLLEGILPAEILVAKSPGMF